MIREEEKMELRSGRLALGALIVGCAALTGWACLVGWATLNYLAK